MSKALVLITVSGGVADYNSEGDVEVVVVDFDNLEAGDSPPHLSDEMLRLAREGSPDVADLYQTCGPCDCEDCKPK